MWLCQVLCSTPTYVTTDSDEPAIPNISYCVKKQGNLHAVIEMMESYKQMDETSVSSCRRGHQTT